MNSRVVPLGAALARILLPAGIVLLAAACGGGPVHGMLSSPGYDKAFRACEQLAPVSGRLIGRGKAMADQALSVAACMRAHGIAGYPDPAMIGGGAHVPDLWAIGVDTHTLQFAAAGEACKAGDLWPDEWWWPAGSLSTAP